MTIYQSFYSLLINLSLFAALIFGLNGYPFSIILVLFLFVMSLQVLEFNEFSLQQTRPYQKQPIALCAKIFFFIIPSASFLLFSYLLGSLFNNFI